jgi:hypothetical protein
MRLKTRIAGMAVAAAATLATGLAAAPAHAYSCPHKAICVHMHHVGKSDWRWNSYYYCTDFYLGSWVPTSYINHQTRGTKARFKNSSKQVIQTTPGAYSAGSVQHPYRTYYVRPC